MSTIDHRTEGSYKEMIMSYNMGILESAKLFYFHFGIKVVTSFIDITAKAYSETLSRRKV